MKLYLLWTPFVLVVRVPCMVRVFPTVRFRAVKLSMDVIKVRPSGGFRDPYPMRPL